MRKLFLLILITCATAPAFTQRSADYGFSAGMTTYVGDINESNLFYNPGPAFQLFYRYNFNPRQSVRANILGGNIKADGADFDNLMEPAASTSFSGIVGEFGVTYEYNFFPYSTMRSRRVDYTPYIAAGAALSVANTSDFHMFPSIPFSAGFKINVANHLGLEFEYGFRKTFYDNFDGLTDNVDPDDQTWMHNNDWYTFMGVSITWKMYNKLVGCPAFADFAEDPKRKR